jgi:hypothetical protein
MIAFVAMIVGLALTCLDLPIPATEKIRGKNGAGDLCLGSDSLVAQWVLMMLMDFLTIVHILLRSVILYGVKCGAKVYCKIHARNFQIGAKEIHIGQGQG